MLKVDLSCLKKKSTVYLFIGIECTMHLYLYLFFYFSKNKTDKYANII